MNTLFERRIKNKGKILENLKNWQTGALNGIHTYIN